MKVKELIAILQSCDGELPVTVLVYDGTEQGKPEGALEAAIQEKGTVSLEGGGAAPAYLAINCGI